MAQILVIDDDKSIIESFSVLFDGIHSVTGAYNGEEALEILKKQKIDLIFLDYRIPGEDGLKVLKKIKEVDSDVYVIIISGYGNFETIISSMSLGAYDYLEKPLDAEKIKIITRRALELKKVNSYVKLIKDTEFENYSLKMIIGSSEVMQEVFKNIGKLVNNDVTVLITGESGVGKELIAKAVHYNSPRRDEPFITVNCAGLTETLLENELFGHEAQAFTGARTQIRGKFEAAGEGTIFLDEIGDMPLSVQSHLLRVLQEREFQRLGGVRTIKVKARIITATNMNLLEQVKSGNFRKDLYYRINVATINVPPLRQRLEDIPLLVDHFIKKANKKLKKNIQGISKDALCKLQNYNWPGNVRELENIITNICINQQGNYIDSINTQGYNQIVDKKGNIFEDFINDYLKMCEKKENILPPMISTLEKELIKKVGKNVNYNKSEMARVLGISRVTLGKKLESLREHVN